MSLKKNIWLIFILLLLVGAAYMVFFNLSQWDSIKRQSEKTLSSLNLLYLTSVESSLLQQSATLDLLGAQLLKDDLYKNEVESQKILDNLRLDNRAYLGFGLIDVQGNLMVGSSNVKRSKLPNLLKNPKTRESFIKALETDQVVLGSPYFVDAIGSVVLPLRKSIRDESGAVLAIMTVGLDTKSLLPGLEASLLKAYEAEFSSMIVQDITFTRVIMREGVNKLLNLDDVGKPISKAMVQLNEDLLKEQNNLSLDDLRHSSKSAEYFIEPSNKLPVHASLAYSKRYNLWSFVTYEKSELTDQIEALILKSIAVYLSVVMVLFWLFKNLNDNQENTRKQLLNQANHDFLTGLHNRLFLKYVESIWVDSKSEPFYVLFIDLDNFKHINDSYGHNLGDKILIEVGKRLKQSFSNDDLVCRQGGDEFIVLCKESIKEHMEFKVKQVFDEVTRSYHIDSYNFHLGASLGISHFPEDGNTFQTLFSAADSAMYDAKHKNLNYEFYTKDIADKAIRKAKVEQALHTALQNKEIFMAYQPQINSDGSIFGVEALVRWNNAELGFVGPNEFISVAENNGLILDLGDFILNQSMSDIKQLTSQYGLEHVNLSINISVVQFLSEGFIGRLKSIMQMTEFPVEQLTLEITESIFIDDFDYILPLFKQLRSLGTKFSLDDFGTGYSSLCMLKKLPIDELKIDKSFVDPIVNNEEDLSILVNILEIARSLKLQVVAEGIEEKEQADLLNGHCSIVQQGYYYSKPISYNELLEFFKTHSST